MFKGQDRLLRLLVVVVAIEVLIAFIVRGPSIERVVQGRAHPVDYLAVAGLLWLPLLLAVIWRVSSRTAALRRDLEDREEHLTSLAVTSHDWIWQADAELVIMACSPASAQLLGYSAPELIGRGLFDFVHEDDQALARAVHANAVIERCGWTDVDLRWRHRSGQVVTLQGSATPVVNTFGLVIGFRGSRRTAPEGTSVERALEQVALRTREVIDTRSLQIALQPIIDLSTGRWSGAEALSRFADGKRPDLWFADAHRAGVGIALELHALACAVDSLADLPDDGYLSINASPAVILDPGLYRLLERPDLPIHRVVLEITEHTAVSRYADISSALRKLRERGLRLAVDDTGAGYASFAHVLELRPDIIKLDRSLVTGIDVDAARRAFVTAIVVLALELHATVTAEGVETTGELNLLRQLGVHTAQGYLLARPTLNPSVVKTWPSTEWFAPPVALNGRSNPTSA